MLFVLLLLIECAFSAPSKDKITNLPQWNQSLGNQYSGYIDVAPSTGRFLHYWFVESPSKSNPVVLWMNGYVYLTSGIYCSGDQGAPALMEHGPIHFSANPDGSFDLVSNPYAWTQYANIIFLEAPAGVGFSYSNNPNDYYTDDNRTADDNYVFLQKWFEQFPEYINNDFWISGESYAGVYVPTLASRVLAGNLNGQFKPKFRGVMVGNGVTNSPNVTVVNSYISFMLGHGFISTNQYSNIEQACVNPNSGQCQNLLNNAFGNMADIDVRQPENWDSMYDVYGDCYHQRPVDKSFMSKIGKAPKPDPIMQQKKRMELGDIPCVDSGFGETYLNIPALQSAIHVKPGIQWTVCNSLINQNYQRTPDSMVPIYQNLIKNKRRVFIYSGDTDFAVPFTDTQVWTANDVGLPPQQEWVPWYFDDDEGSQVGGFKTEYGSGFTFATVRGSGHMVPQFRPVPALAMFQRILTGKPL